MFGVLANNTKYQGNSYWLKKKSALKVVII